MNPFQIIDGGNYTQASTATIQNVALTQRPDFFWVRNRTNWGDTTAVTSIESWWRRGMAQAAFQATDQAVTTNILSSNVGTTNGFTFIDTTNPPTFAALACTAVNATTWVVSMTNTGSIAVGDFVRLYNIAGMQEVSGYVFQVTAVSANTSITLGYMANSTHGISVNGTTGSVLKIYPNQYYPRVRRITSITRAAQAVVNFAQKNDFTPGEIVSFRCPSLFGMTQINNVSARVLSVVNEAPTLGGAGHPVSSITVDLDTSGFTAFAFPSSANAFLVTQVPVCIPASSGVVPDPTNTALNQQPPGTNLLDAFDNRNQFVMQLGTSVAGPANAVMDWVAARYSRFNGQ